MVVVAQLVRVLVCGAEGRRFEPGQPPKTQKLRRNSRLFLWCHCECNAVERSNLTSKTTIFHLYPPQDGRLYWPIPRRLKKPIAFFLSKHRIQFYRLHPLPRDNQHEHR